MPRATAYLLHGFMGVGKTTYARTLERERNAFRFTHDEWMTRLYGSDPPAALFQDYSCRVSDLMQQLWTRCLRLGCDVVLDFGFWTRAEREQVRHVVSEIGADAVLCRLTCPDDVARIRVEQRNRRLGTELYITPETYTALRIRFEPLAPGEQFIDIPHAWE